MAYSPRSIAVSDDEVAPLLGQVALGALLVILEIGPGPLEEIAVLIALTLRGCDPALDRLRHLQDG